jgi:hypothetical protein
MRRSPEALTDDRLVPTAVVGAIGIHLAGRLGFVVGPGTKILGFVFPLVSQCGLSSCPGSPSGGIGLYLVGFSAVNGRLATVLGGFLPAVLVTIAVAAVENDRNDHGDHHQYCDSNNYGYERVVIHDSSIG